MCINKLKVGSNYHVQVCKSAPNYFRNFRNKPLSVGTSTSDWCVCLFVVGYDQRDRLSLPLMWGPSDLKGEHRHGWTSQLTYPSFSVITASSYQTARNKIIIKDICCGDLSFMITQASKNASGLLCPAQQCHKGQYGCCKACCDKTKWLSSRR